MIPQPSNTHVEDKRSCPSCGAPWVVATITVESDPVADERARAIAALLKVPEDLIAKTQKMTVQLDVNVAREGGKMVCIKCGKEIPKNYVDKDVLERGI